MKLYLVGAVPIEAIAMLATQVKQLEVITDVDDTMLKAANAEDVVLWYPQVVPTASEGVARFEGVSAHLGLCTPVHGETPELMMVRLREIADEIDGMLIDLAGFVVSYETYGDGEMDSNSLVSRYLWLRLRNWFLPDQWYSKRYYGAATYPEVWNLETVKDDIQTMKRLHMNFTRIGEFMWEMLEPKMGEYHFELLEQALRLYASAGIDVMVCTPTPTPPRWLTYQHPERCVHNSDGTIMSHGSRQHVCTNNAFFQDRAYRITRELARVVKNHSNVVGVQLDNEFKCHVNQCFCPTCEIRWHQWLKLRYGSIDRLNQAWGTCVWSETYGDFEEVPMPTVTPFLHNPSLLNAFQRFTSESVGEFAEGLTHILRQKLDVPLTHNSSLGFHVLNRQLFSQLDMVGFDTYAPANQFGAFSMNLAMYRNVKADTRDFMLLETSTSHAGYTQNYVTPHPQGYLPNEAFLGFGAGLRTFNYWLFRQHRFGVEQPHSAVVTAWGEPEINMADVEATGKMIVALQPELAATKPVKNTVALMYSDVAKHFYEGENGGYYDYRRLITELYQSLLRAGVNVELVQESAELGQFSLVFVPFIRHVSAALLARFKGFCAAGGKLLLGPMTGDRTGDSTLPVSNGLDRVGEWLGLSMIRQFSQHESPLTARSEQGDVLLQDLITVFNPPDNWRTLVQATNHQAIYASGKVSRGTVMYLGALPSDLAGRWWQRFIQTEILPATATSERLRLDSGLIMYQRSGDGFDDYFIANMVAHPCTVTCLQEGFSYDGLPVTSLTVAAFNHVILHQVVEGAEVNVQKAVSLH